MAVTFRKRYSVFFKIPLRFFKFGESSMKKFTLVLGLICSVLWLSGCATAPSNPPVSDDHGSVQTAPAKHHHIDYKGESLHK